MKMPAGVTPLLIGAGAVLILAAVGARLWAKGGGAGGLAAGAVGGAVDAAGGAVAGGASKVGELFGLPTMTQTTQDPAVARFVIDNYGYMEASKWASLGALVKGAAMAADSGYPPPPGSPLSLAIVSGALGPPKDLDLGGSDTYKWD